VTVGYLLKNNLVWLYSFKLTKTLELLQVAPKTSGLEGDLQKTRLVKTSVTDRTSVYAFLLDLKKDWRFVKRA
jgi:hypothetical protein